MKIVKRIAAAFAALIILSSIGGYLFFEKKFTPPANYLTVSSSTEMLPIKWLESSENPFAALLLPVQLAGSESTFYMQLDFGSPQTLVYSRPLESLQARFPDSMTLSEDSTNTALKFNLGKMTVSSESFRVINYGSEIDFDAPKKINVIGTIGTDLLEKRVIEMDFINHTCSFLESLSSENLSPLSFKKRRILLPASIGGDELELMFDSGTSGYQFITNKEQWNEYKLPNAELKTEKGNSWGNNLKMLTASADEEINFGGLSLPLSEVTYIEGTSKVQNLLMKLSGMDGMIGNKLFLGYKIVLDCKTERFKLEKPE